MKVTSAYLEITNICNLDCRSCYNRSGRTKTRRELSLAQIQAMSDRFVKEFDCHYIALAGGEPTLHSEFDAILAHLLSYSDMKVGVVTNGTVHNPYLVEAYHKYPNLKVQVSLDGSCEEVNAKTRGSGNFRKAMDFLTALAHPAKAPTMKMVISKHNLHDVEAYYRLALSLHCVPDFVFVNSLGNASDVWESIEPTPQQKLAVVRTLDRLNEECKQEVLLPLCTESCPFSDENAGLSVLVKCDGAVQPCQILYDDAYCLGNILSDETALFTARREWLAQLAEKRTQPTENCGKCLARMSCKRGCLAFAVMKSGDPLASDGECTFRKLQLLGYEVMKRGNVYDKSSDT